MSTTTHPFEAAKLGYAPFRCVGCRENWFVMPGFGRKPGGTCHYCGTGILYEYVIVDKNGKQFVVGCECVRKTGSNVANFDNVRKEQARKVRQLRSQAQRAARQAEREAARREREAEYAEEVAAWKQEHTALVNQIYAYTGTNEFMLSVQNQLTANRRLTDRQVEAVEAMFARQEKQRVVAATSKHVGTPGQRVKGVMIRVLRSLKVGVSNFGYREVPRVLITMEDEHGNQLTWWTDHYEDSGEQYRAADFTVKDHGEYNGVAQTVVQRVAFK